MHFPLWRSHTRMLLSHDPDQSVFPSLERPPDSLALSVLSGFKCILRFEDPTCCCPMIQIKAFSHRSKGSQNSIRVNVLSGFKCIFRFGDPTHECCCSHDPIKAFFHRSKGSPNSLRVSVLSGFKCILRFGDPTCCCPMIQIKAFSHARKAHRTHFA
jgi:hypothetical protein